MGQCGLRNSWADITIQSYNSLNHQLLHLECSPITPKPHFELKLFKWHQLWDSSITFCGCFGNSRNSDHSCIYKHLVWFTIQPCGFIWRFGKCSMYTIWWENCHTKCEPVNSNVPSWVRHTSASFRGHYSFNQSEIYWSYRLTN